MPRAPRPYLPGVEVHDIRLVLIRRADLEAEELGGSGDLVKLERPRTLQRRSRKAPGHAASARVRSLLLASLLLAGATASPSGRGARAPGSEER
jgi:hypothetical protein